MNTIKKYTRLIGVLLLALAMAWACFAMAHYGATRYAAGVQDGRNEVLADDARAVAQAQLARDDLDAFSAAAGHQLHQTLGVQLPAIQEQTHDTVEAIRTIYRDRVVPVDVCSRPDGVQAQLDQAIDRANAAARTTGDLRSDAASRSAAEGAATTNGG
ncbi:MAG: hypothetical protein WA777_11210 [Rhodanobacter sp.]